MNVARIVAVTLRETQHGSGFGSPKLMLRHGEPLLESCFITRSVMATLKTRRI